MAVAYGQPSLLCYRPLRWLKIANWRTGGLVLRCCVVYSGDFQVGPLVYVMTPPPLMSPNAGWPTMQTTINTLYPKLIPMMRIATPGVRGAFPCF